MSKDPKEAHDKGFRDGAREKNDHSDAISKAIGGFFDSPYKGDRDYPKSYSEGFKQGNKKG
jgi:hypothetical protein